MRQLFFAMTLIGAGLSMPVAAQEPTRQLIELTPLADVANTPSLWALIETALRKATIAPVIEKLGLPMTPDMFQGQVVDLIAGGPEEFIVAFTAACGNSGCWTYVLEFRDGRLAVVAESVLPETFVVTRAPGETYGTISGYRHGLRWNGRRWVQFCTESRYCG